MTTYPLNNVLYTAEDAELFNCTRTSGIFAGDDFSCLITGADNNITIQAGIGWIKNSRFSGKVIALKAPVVLELGIADSIYPRIDAIVIRFDATKNQTEIAVKQGVASATPLPPDVIRSESVYELHLYHVLREVEKITITSAAVTDVRLNPRYCGLMADSVTQIDTSAIWAQVENLIKNADERIGELIQDHLQEAKDSGEFDGTSITSVEQTKTSTEDGGENEITVSLSNNEKSTFVVKNGRKGDKGDKGDPGTTDFNQLQNKPTTERWTFTLADGSTIVKEMYAETLTKTITSVVISGSSPSATVIHNGRRYNGAFTFKATKGDTITIEASSYVSGTEIIVNGVVVKEAPEKETITYEHTVTRDILIEHGSVGPNTGSVAKVIITDK